MHPVPISLVHAFTTELAVSANPAVEIGRPPNLDLADLHCEHLTLHSADNAPHWRVQLRLQQDATLKNNSPYSFRWAGEGWFELAPNFPAERAEDFVTVNGTSILYGLAREQLRQIMSMGPLVPIMLPAVTFARQPTQPVPQAALASPSQ